MTITFSLLGYILLLAILVNYGTVYDYAVKKGYEGFLTRLIALIPVFGYLHFQKKESLKIVSDRELKHLLSFEILGKRIAWYGLLLIVATLIIVPVSFLVYTSINNSLLQTMFTVYVIIISFMLHQGLVVDYASKKGYEGIKPGLIGLIPVYGFIYYNYQPKRRNVSKQAIREVFKFSSIIQKVFVYAQITLVAVVVIVPVIYIFGMAFSNLRTDIPNQIWPDTPSWEAFRYLFDETNFARWYWNTLKIALINMTVGTFLITGAAYVFARFSFKGKKAGLLTILVSQIHLNP